MLEKKPLNLFLLHAATFYFLLHPVQSGEANGSLTSTSTTTPGLNLYNLPVLCPLCGAAHSTRLQQMFDTWLPLRFCRQRSSLFGVCCSAEADEESFDLPTYPALCPSCREPAASSVRSRSGVGPRQGLDSAVPTHPDVVVGRPSSASCLQEGGSRRPAATPTCRFCSSSFEASGKVKCCERCQSWICRNCNRQPSFFRQPSCFFLQRLLRRGKSGCGNEVCDAAWRDGWGIRPGGRRCFISSTRIRPRRFKLKM